MDSSSDVIEDSADESKVDNSLYVSSNNISSSVENSLPGRPSYAEEVEESDPESDVNSSYQSPESGKYEENTPRSTNKSFVSSDEDAEFEASVKTRKNRVRRIVSDSGDESELAGPPATNYSFTNMRTSKVIDSDEDDNSSVTSLAEISENLKEIDDNEVDKLSLSMNNSVTLDEKDASSSNKNHTINTSNLNKTANEEASHSVKSHTTTQGVKSTNIKTIYCNLNETPNESFRLPAEEISSSSEKSDNEVISVPSSDNEEENTTDKLKTNTAPKFQQPTIDSMVKNMSLLGAQNDQIYCSAGEYANQSSKIANIRTDILKTKNILRTVNLSSLPDKGSLLMQRQRNLEAKLVEEENKLKKMVVNHEAPTQKPTWDQLQANSSHVVPNTFGKQAMNTYVVQKTLTMDRLKNLHDSLATCPGDDTLAEDPKGIKVELMTHQKRALAWLIWREGQKPSGGILADDMGLGKTLTMISLILATKENDIDDNNSDSSNESEKSDKWTKKNKKYRANGGTLVVCPATLIRQWESEIESKLKRNLLSTELYHGTKRETSAARLAKYDVVITTYKLAQGELEKKGPLYNIKWKRIILDEAHVIRNPKSQTSVATCELKAKSRWVLTGTPVHNKELDLYALLKFLRCSPFDDLAIWKRWVANKNAGGQDRLNTVIQSILLRRTKDQLQEQGGLQSLPEKKFEVIEVSLDNSEKQIYQKLLVFSKTLFVQFLHQRAEKNPEFSNIKGGDLKQTNDAEFNKMHRKVMQMHGNTEVKAHEILVLLLRLRQICCHPSLISSMLDKEDCAAEGIEEEGVDIDMLDKLSNLNLDDNIENKDPSSNEPEKLNAVASKVLSSSNPVFDEDRTNQKLRTIQKIIEEKVLPNDDKIIIVSQWTSMLNLVMRHLKSSRIRCDILDGKVPVHKRNDIVVNFNNPASKEKVLLLSLTAGGVGLNLVGANHLLLVDLHWNPQLESQAQDRIYRVGQKKTVFIYKIVTSETIEERIKTLQDSKLSMASDILSGVRPGAGSKLSLDDLKMLFNVAG